jgi:enoyl-[acyl-carrier protein] reductase I
MLKGKNVLLTGLMSDRSIAYGIAEAMYREGANLAFTYVNEQMKDRVAKLAAKFNPAALIPCDVSIDADIVQCFETLGRTWGHLDVLVHSIAFAPADQLDGDFIANINREGFRIAHDVSSYSLCAMAKAGRSLMQGRNGAILTLTYLGGEKAVVNYNTMGLAKASLDAAVRYSAVALGGEGIRVNAISAGPIRTLAASGIKGFRKMLDYNAKVSPLKRNVTTEEVGNVAAFLCSDLASAITAEIIHVDCGFSQVAVPPLGDE